MNAPSERGLINSVSTKLRLEHVRHFSGLSAPHYLAVFERLAGAQRSRVKLSWAALLGGPYWAAARGLWGLFWLSLVLDTVGACWAFSEWRSTAPAEGILVLAFGRLLVGFAGNWAYWQAFCTWRVGSKSSHRFDAWRLLLAAGMALPAFALIVLQTAGYPLPELVRSFPVARTISIATQNGINQTVHWLTVSCGPFFDAITLAVRGVLDAIERVLLAMPWPAQVLVLLLLAWRAGGVRALLFAAGILAYLGLFGFWEKAISTMSLVAAAVLICVLFGVPLGILCAKYRMLNRIANPVMDFMQTMPSFVYLLPAIAFFSIGKPPAVLATVVFAMPPVIKLTALGIQGVPRDVKEAMLAFGASPLQLLVKAELPMAIDSIMTGINQSIMMSLSMVVISALIGAGGLGFDVLSALQQMENGAGLLAGLAIVLCAMLLDRLVQGRNGAGDKHKGKE
ncbi:ABC transporter permease subunit [Aquincola sp. S2]|uniref:ABC transporter permease subunit n=1 Tax=Pseudaquabacterium terrae TaxID=2732868 RepID=A0ABX2EU95_9BURK|nr:ABC transporter permease subunit [Aquabacterium terrae]